MALGGVASPAEPGRQGFDCNTVLSTIKAKALKAAGFDFAVRYLSRGIVEAPHDLTATEARRILGAGLALMAVQHVERAPWKPDEALGLTYGRNAARHARAVGFPQDVCVWLDLEGVDPSVPPETVIAYCNAWFGEVAGAGYAPGLYVGPATNLSGEDFYWRLKTTHYWRSGHPGVPEIPNRGYQMLQTIEPNDVVAGIAIDRNVTVADGFGNSVVWLAP